MPAEFYRGIFERDYWWGPRYNPEALDNLNTTGMAVVKRREGSVLERLFAPIERIEFNWTYRDGIKTLQIEEVSRCDAEIQGYFLNRYIHAERDIKHSCFRHLDGAVKVYTASQHEKRIYQKLSELPKALVKPKLFRIDDELETKSCLELIALFYRSNEMIIEYFDSEKFEAGFGKWNVPYPNVNTV